MLKYGFFCGTWIEFTKEIYLKFWFCTIWLKWLHRTYEPIKTRCCFSVPPENIGGIATPGCNGLNESNIIMFSRLSHHIANCDTAFDKSNFCKVSSRLKLFKKEIPGCKSAQKSWNPFYIFLSVKNQYYLCK